MPGEEFTRYVDSDIHQLVTSLDKYYNEITGHENATTSNRERLRETWIGDGFESFSGKVDRMMTQLQAIQDTLKQGRNKVMEANTMIQGADKKVAALFEA
ncbi:WXG100 family type VII secretion target [Nocardia sp. NPDC049190]|uniref:WXG100 family type VII secretion target n=1 Tax=Nocardia sp. NPDC049190 TaxID=3155650 RepID=UPI0033CB8409